MIRNCRHTSVGVLELLVQAALPDLDGPICSITAMTCRGFNIGSLTTSAYFDELRSDELRLDIRLAVLEEHLDHFLQVGIELVERFPLRVRAGETRHEPHVKARLGIALDHGREGPSHEG
jgi:hypothetical protein